MTRWRSWYTMVVGVALMVVGVVLAMLMVMQRLESTFLLNFLTYSTSMGGLITAMIGTATHVVGRRDREEGELWR